MTSFTGLPNRLWSLTVRHPVLVAAALVAIETLFTLNARSLWFSDEVRYADVYRHLSEFGHWMVLNLNGVPYPDKPPIYFWLLWILDQIPFVDSPTNLFLGSAVSGVLFLAATDSLARALGLNREERAATQLVLLSSLLVVAVFHYVRMDLLFSAFMLWAIAAFWRHYVGGAPTSTGVLGYFLTGLAVLTKGPLGFAIPMLVLVLFLAWAGKLRRLMSAATWIGIPVALATVAAWLVGVVLVAGPDFLLDRIFGQQIISRATDAFHHKEPAHYYLRIVPLALLPWTFFLAAAPRATLSPAHLRGVIATRRDHGINGFLILSSLGIFLFLSALSGKVAIYVLPMLPFVAMLVARSVTGNAGGNAGRGLIAVGVGLGLLAIASLAGALTGDGQVSATGLASGAAILAVAAMAAILLRQAPRAALTSLALLTGVWVIAQSIWTFPSLDSSISTKPQGEIIREFAEDGFHPIAYRTYSGIFTYYSGRNLDEISAQSQLTERLSEHDRIVLVLRERHWSELPGLHEQFRVVDRRRIEGGGGVYLVLVRE